MGQPEDNKEPLDKNEGEGNEEDKKSRFKLPFAFNFDSILKEIFRFLIFILFVFIIVFFVQGRDQGGFSLEEIREIDNEGLENVFPGSTKEWVSEEMLVNTADEFANHFIRASLVINYDAQDSELESTLFSKRNLIYAETRKIISRKKYLELKNVRNQDILIEEIKTTIQRIVQLPGIRSVFFRDFTIH